MKILALESSADETAAAIVENGTNILANFTASQIDIHAKYGGIVPEVAARSHITEIIAVLDEALTQARITISDVDAIAFTRGPGLIGSLLIGTLTAKTLATIFDKPIVGVNHIIAHAFAAELDNNELRFPLLALTVSGGHSALTLYHENLDFEILGETQDDAAGEAFDKVAKLLGLPYPGGPAISKLAEQGDEKAFKFPIAKMQNELDFSFSGLKTAVLRVVREYEGNKNLTDQLKADIAASFEHTVVKSLVQATERAYQTYRPSQLVVGGGVAANRKLRSELTRALPEAIFVPNALCGDNAAMIASLAARMLQNGYSKSPVQISADSSLESL